MREFIYISPSDKEERLINPAEIREIYRANDTIAYSFTDGEMSIAKMESEEDAIAAFKAIKL